MQIPFTKDICQVLSYYQKLFNYQRILAFPCVEDNMITPSYCSDSGDKKVFKSDKRLEWLNFQSKFLTRKDVGSVTSASELFTFFNLDLLMPIRFDNTCFGFLGINTYNRVVSEVELEIGELITHYLASSWKNLDLLRGVRRFSEQTQNLLEEMSTLLEISRALESGRELQSLLEFIADKCMEVMRAEAASIMLMVEDKKELEFRVALGPKGKEVKPYRLALGQGIGGWVAENGKPLLIANAYEDQRFDPSFDQRSGFETKSVICVPLVYQDEILGVMEALNRTDGKPFSYDDVRIFTIFATQVALAIQNSRLLFSEIERKRLEKDIEVASEIQRLIIPSDLPLISDLDISGLYIPSLHVGGDFYTILPINKNETVVCIADVSGKGVPGALLVSTLHATLKAYLEFSNDLLSVMNKLNNLIIELSTTDRYITLFLGCYDKRTSELTYINAGHMPPLLMKQKEKIERLKTTGIAIGIMAFEYQVKSVKLEENDILALYTDGVSEAKNEKNEFFGEEKIKDIIKKKHQENSETIRNEIVHTVKEYTNYNTLSDDLTLLIIKKAGRNIKRR
jgi:sigma-B regulation protein RsbU (phosphoserine phosphatase)